MLQKVRHNYKDFRRFLTGSGGSMQHIRDKGTVARVLWLLSGGGSRLRAERGADGYHVSQSLRHDSSQSDREVVVATEPQYNRAIPDSRVGGEIDVSRISLNSFRCTVRSC